MRNIVAFLLIAMASGSLSAQLTDCKPARIDGRFSEAEWAGGAAYDFPANFREGHVSCALYLRNDARNLYAAFRCHGEITVFEFALQLRRRGSKSIDDVLYAHRQRPQGLTFLDGFQDPSQAMLWDAQSGGSNDGGAAAGFSDGWLIVEMWHPLSSPDRHDIHLRPGDSVMVRSAIGLWDVKGNKYDTEWPAQPPLGRTYQVRDCR